MAAIPNVSPEARAIAASMMSALSTSATDEAETLYNELCAVHPRARELRIYPVTIAIQRGHAADALRELRDEGEDRHPELQALCLHTLDDPMWRGLAESLVNTHPRDDVRLAMRQLLGQTPDATFNPLN